MLADIETALRMKKAIAFRAAEHVQDFLPMSKRDILKFEGCAVAWQRALAKAGLSLGDLSFVETHDCFTIAELIEYEAMGLTKEGEGAVAIKEGWTQKDGKLPVNPSGGLKAKGHPIGATGVSMHALTAMQLTGTAGDLQIQTPRSAEFSIWAAQRSRTTSAFSSVSNSAWNRLFPRKLPPRADVLGVSAGRPRRRGSREAAMTNVPTDLLRTVVTVVDLGSYTRAAAALGVTQPAVSAQIKRLQILLGADLFERSSQGVRLTPPANWWSGVRGACCRSMTKFWIAPMSARRSELVVRIGTPSDFVASVLPETLARFRARPMCASWCARISPRR